MCPGLNQEIPGASDISGKYDYWITADIPAFCDDLLLSFKDDGKTAWTDVEWMMQPKNYDFPVDEEGDQTFVFKMAEGSTENLFKVSKYRRLRKSKLEQEQEQEELRVKVEVGGDGRLDATMQGFRKVITYHPWLMGQTRGRYLKEYSFWMTMPCGRRVGGLE